MFAKQAAEVVAVHKTASCGDILDFEIVAFKQLSGMFKSGLGQVFIESDTANFLKEMGKIVWGDVERLRHRFTR